MAKVNNKTNSKVMKPKKTRKTKKSKKVEEVVVEPVMEEVVVEEPTKEVVVEEPTKEVVVEEPTKEVVVEEPTKEKLVNNVVNDVVSALSQDEDVKIELEFTKVVHNMKNVVEDVRNMLKSTKLLHVRVNRRIRQLNKKQKGTRRTGVDQRKNPSGFNKPTHISKELSTFLGVDKDIELPRTEVTRRVNSYIKEHGLQNPSDRRQINCDDKLKDLLKPKDVQVSYFNLQTFLSPHFMK